jgi:hypothetical protein
MFAPLVRLMGCLASAVAVQAPLQAPPARPSLEELRNALTVEPVPRDELALALLALRRGAASEGRARLERVLASGLEQEERARLERERARLAAWIQARDEFLARRCEERKEVEIQDGKHKLKAKVSRDPTSGFVLEAGGLRWSEETLEPLQIAQQMETERAGWVRFYPYVVGGDERWKKLLREPSSEAEALRADAAGYAELLRNGALLEWLDAQARQAAPTTLTGAEAWLEALAEGGSGFADLVLYERKLSALRGLARGVAETAFELAKPWTHLHARAEELEESRVRLTYEFTDPSELEDFETLDYPKGYEPDPMSAGRWRVEEGRLQGSGRACLRTLFDFEAPLSVRYTLALDEPSDRCWLNLGICDDGQGQFAWAMNFHHLEVWAPGARKLAAGRNKVYYENQFYEQELRHDGKHVTLASNGTEQQKLACAARSGAVFLFMSVYSNVRLERLVIEGRFGARPLTRVRERWVERRVREIFPERR